MSGRKVGTVRIASSTPSSAVGVVVGQAGSEVGGLHRAGAASGRHGEPAGREAVAETGRVGVRRVLAGERVAAHHADDPALAGELVERVVDGPVVEGLGEHPAQVVALSPRRDQA